MHVAEVRTRQRNAGIVFVVVLLIVVVTGCFVWKFVLQPARSGRVSLRNAPYRKDVYT